MVKKFFSGEREKAIYKNYDYLLKFLEDIKDLVYKSKIKYMPTIECKIECLRRTEEEKKSKDQKNLFKLNCISKFKNKYNNNKIQIFKDENILVNSIDSKSKGLIYLINELCSDDYNEI